MKGMKWLRMVVVFRLGSDHISEGPYDPLLADSWSHLRYVEVNIDGLQNKLTALNDSGCQLCVVRAEVIQPLD